MSPESSVLRVASCRTVPPAKWPPSRSSVRPPKSARVSPDQSSIAVVGPHDPLAVGLVEQDRDAAERAAPLDHAGVVVRVRDRDRAHLAAGAHGLEAGVVDERDHVPDHVALRRLRERAGAGRSRRTARSRRRDSRQSSRASLRRSARSSSSVVQRWPPAADVLPLVLADRAELGRRLPLGELRAAGRADEVRHGVRR